MSSQPRLRPSFLVIGSQKGGTTALYTYLSHHPDIVAPEEKEIHFFLCDLRYARGLDFYHSHFPPEDPSSPQRITFEASPNYLTSAEAARRIHAYDPKIKLVVLLRDPILRAHSAWQMYRRFFRINGDWYFEWMENCEARVDRDSFVRRPASFGFSFRDDIAAELETVARGERIEAPFLRHGFYEEQLKAYRKLFSSEQMLIESSERFRDQTEAVLAEIVGFLGIAEHVWNQELLKPVFVGTYNDSLPQDATALLKEVYEDRNQRLYALLGREFLWL
jgi:hypothetical protein